MVWTGVWHHKVDGNELNDLANFITQVPEVENGFEQDVILAPRDGDYPAFIRLQPTEGRVTFLIAMRNATWVDWHTRLEFLRSVFTPGAHVYEGQVRGMPTLLGFRFVHAGGMMLDPKSKLVSISATVPKPVLAAM